MGPFWVTKKKTGAKHKHIALRPCPQATDFSNFIPDFVLSSSLDMYQLRPQASFLASVFCTLCCGWVGPLTEPWLNELASYSVVCLRGQARRRRRKIIIIPYPHPWMMPPPPPLPMTTLAAIGGKGVAACSWVDSTLVRTHLMPRQRQRRSYDDEDVAGTRDGNNIEDGGSNSGRWTA